MRSGVKVCVCGLGEKVAEERHRERRRTRRKSDMVVSLYECSWLCVLREREREKWKGNCLNPSRYEKGFWIGCNCSCIFWPYLAVFSTRLSHMSIFQKMSGFFFFFNIKIYDNKKPSNFQNLILGKYFVKLLLNLKLLLLNFDLLIF